MRPRIDDGRVNAPTSSDSRLGTAGSQPRLAGIRVAIVLKWAGFGGAERQALALARHLKEIEGASVEVQALSDADGRAVAEFHEAGIPWRARKRRWRGSRSRTFLRLASTTTELRRARPDVLLPYCDVPNVVCGLVWRYAGARTCVWSQRDTFPFTLDDAFVRRALRTTPVIVSNSHHGAEYIETFGAPRERIRVIPNGVDLEPTDTSPTTWRRRLGTSDEDVVVTSLAHFYERKDHATLLDAWRRVLDGADGSRDRLTLVLAGRPEGRRSLLEARARDLEVDDRVRFVGDVEDVAGLLAASDIGVLSSPNEGCSNAVLEKMAFGLPIVASDVPGIRDVIGADTGPLLVPPGDAEAFASVLALLCSDPALRTRVGSRNAARQQASFGREQMLERTVDAILDGLAERGSDRRLAA